MDQPKIHIDHADLIDCSIAVIEDHVNPGLFASKLSPEYRRALWVLLSEELADDSLLDRFRPNRDKG